MDLDTRRPRRTMPGLREVLGRAAPPRAVSPWLPVLDVLRRYDPVALRYSPDGTRLVVAGRHTGVRSYEIGLRAVVTAVCGRAGGALPRSRWQGLVDRVPFTEGCPVRPASG
ncbi:hypothetical protein LG634_29035 [Streptomyces bambusae]|uniref:hypothetical protein n=1 Tax=Streptomyces bambusae TaxID=1550616 RepID=UPI001CFE69DC|nr:hypothetical protein [Streptomyces bambusae]MCB5168851.1 hypothetical protein [Streptomyces bambusae]